MSYYAVRFSSAPEQVRIAQAAGPVEAFKLAFGRGTRGGEWKKLDPKAYRSDTKRIAAINTAAGWEKFQEKTK